MRLLRLLSLAAGLALLAPPTARAQTTYKIQPILKVGDMAGDVLIPTTHFLIVEALNDNGQILIMTVRKQTFQPRMLFQYGDGKFTPIVVGTREAAGGKWPANVIVRQPLTMNQKGNVAFTAQILINNSPSWGTFLWDASVQQVKPVALKGMPAPGNLVFRQGGSAGGTGAYINNHDEIAFTADVPSSQGDAAGLFFRGQDGQLQAAVLPDQELPGGAKLLGAYFPKLNDAGMIAFQAWRLPPGSDNDQPSGYLWEKGTLSVIAKIGQDAPDGGKFRVVSPTNISNSDRSVLVLGELYDPFRTVLYRFLDGKLTRLLEAGMTMPGGGKLTAFDDLAAPTNVAGQYVFGAQLEDGSTGIYRLEPDGKITELLKSGTKTDLGTITRIEFGLRGESIGLVVNNKGQIATVVSIDGGPDTIVLLTPPTP
jgi:hypothetical protein